MLATSVTSKQLATISILERIGSAISLIGIMFIICTFLLNKAFHKSINRLIFYASVGNVFTCIGTMISRNAINGGTETNSLCVLQAFLIQWFMPADALWAFVMALNVYLTFYHRFRADQLKALEKWYITFCYGVTFALAFTLLWVKTDERGPVYGNATLWCWISSSWDHYRMYLFYGPVWFFCVNTFLIYIRLCITLSVNYIRLHGFSRGSDPIIPVYNMPIIGTRTTDISFHSDPALPLPIPLQEMRPRSSNVRSQPGPPPIGRTYDCSITGGEDRSPGPSTAQNPNSSRYNTYFARRREPVIIEVTGSPGRVSAPPIAVPAPIAVPRPTTHAQPRIRHSYNTGRADNALKIMGTVALFFFFIMLITWIPSSANRLYSVVNPEQVNLGLQYLAACVLPMQGFWNCVIYIIISRDACKDLWRKLLERSLWNTQNMAATARSAFADNNAVIARPPPVVRRNTTASHISRFPQAEDDSITLLESNYLSRPSSGRSDTGRVNDWDYDSV